MSNPNLRNHVLLMGPTSSTVRTTGLVAASNELRVIQSAEVEGYPRTRLDIRFNDKNEPTNMTVEGRMIYAIGLNADDLLRQAHAVVMAQPPGSITEFPFVVQGEGSPIMRVSKPFVLEITQGEADSIIYHGQVMVQAYDAKKLSRSDDGSRE